MTGPRLKPSAKAGDGRPWKPGQSGNPVGRAFGSRSLLSEAFLKDLLADWQENGPEALKMARAESPATYLRVVASLMPKEIAVKHEVDNLSLADLDVAIDILRAAVAGAVDEVRGDEGDGAGGNQTH